LRRIRGLRQAPRSCTKEQKCSAYYQLAKLHGKFLLSPKKRLPP
jgi:hypothetical protein